MATEANIQESVCLKKGEREENALTSESFEEQVTELPGNQVKQLETSSLVATTAYTPLETGTGKPTDESGIFFQALSVTMVIADEHSNTPESYKAAKPTEPEEETIQIGEKAIESEVCGKDVPEKAEPEVGLKLLDSVEPSKKESFDASEKNQGDGVTSSQDAACEDIKETTEEHVAIVADFKEQDLNETPREIVKKETDDKSVGAQEASEQSEIGSKDTEEQKYKESVKKIEQDEEIEEIKPDVEIAKKEQNGLLQAITPDACASTQTIPQVETTKHEEKEQVVNVLEKDQDEDDVTRAQEVTVEGGLQEKTHHNDDNEREVVEAKESVEEDADVCVSTQTTLVKESIKTEEPDDEKAIEKEACQENGQKKAELEGELEISDSVAPSQKETLSTIEKDQGGTDGVTSLQEQPCVDVEETTTVQGVTTAIDFKEQDLNEEPREFVKEETEDKSLDAKEENEECEKEAKEEIDQNPEESVKKIEKEEETEEVKPGVEIEEKKEQHELLPSVTTDVSITTQTKSQVEKTEHEEEDTQNDDGLKEKSDSPVIKEVYEETGPEKEEYEREVKDSAIEVVIKDEEKEQEVNVLETHEDKVDVTSAQDVTFEKDLQEKNHHNEDDEREVVTAEEREDVTAEERTEEITEVIRSTEKTEQNDIPSDVCISTQTEPKEEATGKNDEEAIEKDDGQTYKSDSSSTALSENETVRKDKDQEKEQEIYVTEKIQSGGDDVTSSENTSNEQEQLAEEIKSIVEITEEKDVCISTQIESQENITENDGDQKEKSDDPSVNEVCEENGLKKTESEEEIKPSDSSVVTTRESVIETTEETNSGDETKENIEQQGVLNVITTDNDDGQTDKHESPLVEVVCEETSTDTAEPEDVKHSDSSSTSLNEKETLDKEENLEKEDDIKNSEAEGGGDDVTSSQSASNEGIEEATIGQHDTNVACVEEGQGVTAKPKDILIEEEEDRSIDAEELGQPNEQNVEETHPTISENPEDEIKKEDKDLSHESVEDTNDDTTKDEKCTLEQEPVKEHTDQDKVSTEKVSDLNETKEVEPKEEIIPSTALSASTEATSNSEKEKAESEKLPTEDLEIVSEEQIPELVPKSEKPVLKEMETHIDEEKGAITKEISSAEKTEVQSGGDAVTSSQNASNEEIQETMIGQHDTTVTFVEEGQGVSATPKEILTEEAEDKSIVAEEIPLELAQPSEQNVEGAHSHLSKIITENPEDEIKKEDKELQHETVKDSNDDTTKEEKCTLEQEPIEVHSGQDEVSKEKVTNLNETAEVKPKEEITPSTSLETSTEDTPNTEKEKAESENLLIEDLKTVSEVQIPELVPELEESTLKEKCIITETETQLDEEKGTVIEEILSDEKTQQTTEIKQETVKEVCEEASSEKAELEEEIKHSDSSYMKINEKEITFKDDNEEKEVNMSTESRSEDNLTSSQIEVSEEKEDVKEKNIHNEGNEGDFIKNGEDVGEDTEESKSSVDIKENTEHVTATNVCSSTKIETDEETIENEVKNGEKAIEHEEYEAVSREENLEKKQEDVEETKMGEHATTNDEKDVCISTQNESQEEPTKNEENAIEPDGDQKEKADNAVVKEVCEENDLTTTESEGRQISNSFEVKTRESVYEDTEETKSSDETNEDTQQQGVLNVITSDVSSSAQTETIEKSTASEENNDVETTENNDGQTEKPESSLVEGVCETTKSEIVESEEGAKQSNILSTTLNENETLSKEEKLEKEDEIKTSEVEGGGVELTSSQNASSEDVKETTIDQHNTTVAHVEEGQSVSALPKEILVEETENKDKSIDTDEVSLELVQPNEQNAEETLPCLTKSISDNPEEEIKKEDTNDNAANEDKRTLEHEPVEEHSSQDEVSKEKLTGLNETKEVEPQEDTPSISTETSTDDTSKTISEAQIPELVTNTEESVLKDECFISETKTHLDEEKSNITEEISSDEKTELTTEIKQETVKEVCEETSSEKTELEEGLKLSDSSTVKINEKEITTFKEDEQEKDQEVNTSAESRGGDNITSSENEVSEEKEELKEKNYHNEGNEGDFNGSVESVETKDTEHVISTSSSTHIEHDEEAIQKDEKKDETAIENDKSEIVSREENLEKKQEDITETNTGEHATAVACFEEEQNLSTITKEAIGKAEEGDKSAIVQEKIEQYDEENVEKERKAEEYNDEIKASVETTEEKDVCISTQTTANHEENNDEETIEQDKGQTEKPEIPLVEVACETTQSEIVESEEEVKQSDSFSTTLNENEILSKEEKLEKGDEIKTSEIEVGEVEVTSSQNASNDDVKETTLDQDITTVAHVEEGSGVSALPKEILIEEAEDNKLVDAEEVIHVNSKSISDNPEDEIKKEDRDLSHESVEDTNDDTKEERRTLEHEHVEEHSGQDEVSKDEVSKEKVTDLHETTEAELKEDITPSVSLETSTEDASNLEKERAEVETLPLENLETVSEVQIPESVPRSEETVLKKECLVSETETHLDEEKETVTEKNSSDEKTEQTTEIKKETVKEVCEGTSSENAKLEEGLKLSDTSNITISEKEITTFKDDSQENNQEVNTSAEIQGEDNIKSSQNEENEDFQEKKAMKDEAVLTEKVSKELEQTKEQNVEETEACLTETISEKTEDNIPKDEDLSHDSTEHINENITKEEKCFPDVMTKEIDISTLKHEPVEEQNDGQDEVSKEILTDSNETIAVKPKEDITPSRSLGTSAEDTSNSDKAKTVSESLPLEDLESVSEVRIPDVTPKSEDLKMEEECLVSETETYADEENRVATKEISSDENLETHGSTQQPEDSYRTTENQLNSTEDCIKTEKNVILTKEIEEVPLEIEKEKEVSDFKDQIVEEDAYSPELEEKSAQNQKETVHEISSSGLIHVENPEATEVNVDQKPKEVESQVDLSNIESTAYPSESEKLATRALESDCDVQIPEVVADSEDSKVKEECIVLATTAEDSVEEQDTKTNEISSAPDKEENVTKAPTESNEAKSSDLIIEEKASTKENPEVHGELEPTYEPAIEDQVTIETKPQPEQSDVTSENITNDQTSESKLEPTSAKDTEEEVTLAHEVETKSVENLHETTKNIILTDEVAVETEKEKERNVTEKQVSEEDNCPTELDSKPTPVQKELADEIEYSKPIPVGNIEVTEVKAESQTEVENTQAAEDLSCLSEASSVTEKSKAEIHENPQQTITVIGEVKDGIIDEASKDKIVLVLEDSKASELQVNLPEIESTDTPSNGQDSMKLEEDVSCKTRETFEEQGPLTSQLADREILEEKDDEPISELQTFSEDQKSIKDIISEEAKLTQLTSDTDVSQIERSSSRTDELLETKDSVEDTENAKLTAENLSVKDEPITEIKKSSEDSEIVASESKKLEDTVPEKEKETLDEPRADDSEKTTYDSILSSEIATETAKIVPECRDAPALLIDNLPEASPETLLAKPEDKITEDREVLPSVEKDVIDVQKHEKDLDYETEVKIADVVSNVECSEIEPRHLDTNQENQKDQKKEADESIKDVIPVEDVKISTRELVIPSVIDATADNANYKTLEVHEAEGLLKDDKHLESTRDQSKPIEEGSGIKQEPLELDASGSRGTAATDDLKISQKYVTGDLIKVSQTHPEVQNREVPGSTVDKQSPKESTGCKILTEKIDSSHEQAEPVAKSLVPEAGNLKVNTTVSVDQKEKSESVEKEEAGVKTDEEDEEEEDHEEDEKTGSCSDAPVMVEASQDMEVKAHKKSHNILSGVGSKVKHSIAKVKKAITGKSSPTKSTSPKAKNQVAG